MSPATLTGALQGQDGPAGCDGSWQGDLRWRRRRRRESSITEVFNPRCVTSSGGPGVGTVTPKRVKRASSLDHFVTGMVQGSQRTSGKTLLLLSDRHGSGSVGVP